MRSNVNFANINEIWSKAENKAENNAENNAENEAENEAIYEYSNSWAMQLNWGWVFVSRKSDVWVNFQQSAYLI